MKITNCRLCKTGILGPPVLDFGKTPLANEFLSTIQEQELFDLQVCCCQQCGHYQLNESIDPERLFRNYVFVAGTSPVNVEHFRQYAIHMTNALKLKSGSKVLDIASNDGTLLQHFKNLGMQVLGIDPAKNIAEMANAKGIETIPEFFTEEYADQIVSKYGTFDLITANNVFAHVPDLANFTEGVKKVLSQNGVFSFEVSYFADVCDKTLFDTIYHEHSSYHTVEPLISFFKSHNMKLIHVEHIGNHGGSIRVIVCHEGQYGNQTISNKWDDRNQMVDKVTKLEKNIKLLGLKLKFKLESLKAQAKSIAIYGTPAKATTLMYALNIDENIIDFAVDDDPLKQGTFTPGKHIPVYSSKAIRDRKPDVLLVLAWNFADPIMKEHQYFMGSWIVPIPELKEHHELSFLS